MDDSLSKVADSVNEGLGRRLGHSTFFEQLYNETVQYMLGYVWHRQNLRIFINRIDK
jgi:hypothetical protein